MILKSLTLKNFKSIGEEPQTINFAPITLLFGPNSAGKSTIMKSLLYLHEIIKTGNADPSKLSRIPDRDIGGFVNLINGHDLSKEMQIKINLICNYLRDGSRGFESIYSGWHHDDNEYWLNPFVDVYELSISISIKWSVLLNAPLVSNYHVFFNGAPVSEISNTIDGANKKIIFYLRNMFRHGFSEEGGGDVFESKIDEFVGIFDHYGANGDYSEVDGGYSIGILGKNMLPKLKTIMGIIDNDGVEDSDHTKYNAFLSDFVVTPLDVVSDFLETSLYLGPLRTIPPRNFSPESKSIPERWTNGMAAWDLLATAGDDFVDAVSKWFGDEEFLNSGYEVRLKRYREFSSSSPLLLAITQNRQELLEPDWFKEQLNKMPELTRIVLWDKRAQIELHPQDLGVGISQVLPVIVLAMLKKQALACIEQPELHIHPAFQVVLGDLFAEAIQIDDTDFKNEIIEQSKSDIYTDFQRELVKKIDVNHIRNEINKHIFLDRKAKIPMLHAHVDKVYSRPTSIIETHSEHLMLRLLKRIRETTDGELEPGAPRLYPLDVAVIYVEPDDDGAKIKNIRINDEGEFVDAWPKGFFGERRQELM